MGFDRAMAEKKAMEMSKCVAAREQTVGELLDQRIHEANRVVTALHDLKASLPGSFLSSGASRILALAGTR